MRIITDRGVTRALIGRGGGGGGVYSYIRVLLDGFLLKPNTVQKCGAPSALSMHIKAYICTDSAQTNKLTNSRTEYKAMPSFWLGHRNQLFLISFQKKSVGQNTNTPPPLINALATPLITETVTYRDGQRKTTASNTMKFTII